MSPEHLWSVHVTVIGISSYHDRLHGTKLRSIGDTFTTLKRNGDERKWFTG